MAEILDFIVDTCTVVAVLENEDDRHPEGQVDAARTLLAMAFRGEVVLRRSAAFDRDWERITDPAKRADRLAWLSSSPLAEPVAGGLFRLDVSALGGRDVLARDQHTELDDNLIRLLGSSGNPEYRAKKSSDRDHLLATVRSGAVGLITLDVDTLLKHRMALCELGVTVLWPCDGLAKVMENARD